MLHLSRVRQLRNSARTLPTHAEQKSENESVPLSLKQSQLIFTTHPIVSKIYNLPTRNR